MSDQQYRNRWRFQPDAASAHAINQIALRENRTVSNTIQTLVKEAIAARRAIAEKTPTYLRLVEAIRGPSEPQ
jgi:hypothetical protein